jgi:hypothetical protein
LQRTQTTKKKKKNCTLFLELIKFSEEKHGHPTSYENFVFQNVKTFNN